VPKRWYNVAMTLQNAADIATIAQLILGIIVAFGGSVLVVRYIHTMKPVWKRFAENVTREVAVVSTEDQSMQHEANILERVGFFKVKAVSADVRNIDLVKSSSLLVVGYSPESEVYDAVLTYAKAHRLPIIVFSGKHRLSNEDRDKLKEYSFSSLCETELRLVSDVFAVMSTFRGEK
jgi:hypothetical protein